MNPNANVTTHSSIGKKHRYWTPSLLLTVCAFGFARLSFAAPQPNSPVDVLDSVMVYGNYGKLSKAQKNLIKAEDDFYRRYNEINKDDAFDIVCSEEAQTGTRLKARICKPKIAVAIEREEVETFFSKVGIGGSFTPTASAKVQSAMLLMRSNMLQAIKSDPELLRLLLVHARALRDYKQLHAEKFKNHWIVQD